MGWMGGAALAIGLSGAALGGITLAQQKPPPLSGPAPEATPPAAPGLDKFGEPAPGAPPGAPPAAREGPAPPAAAASEPPAAARFRALLGPAFTFAYRGAEAIDPAGNSVRLLGATLAHQGTRAAIEELTLDGPAADRIAAASARDIAVTGRDGGVTRIARLELRGLATPQGAAPPGTLLLDSLRLEAVTIAGDPQVAIAEIGVEEYGGGRPGRVTVSGIDVLAPRLGLVDRLRIGRITLRGIDLAATVAATAAQQAPPRSAGGYTLEVEAVAASRGDAPVGTLGALRIQGDPEAGGIEAGRLALRELRLAPAAGLAGWLRRFGYPALLADLTAESRYDRAAGRLELGPLSLAGREMGLLGLTLVLEGVTPEAAEAGDWETLRLAGATLRVLDQSLYGRAVRDQARRLRLPESRVREQWASQARGALTSGDLSRDGSGAMAPVVAALQRFLRGETQEVELVARPPRPVPLGDLPAALVRGAAETQRVLGLGAAAR